MLIKDVRKNRSALPVVLIFILILLLIGWGLVQTNEAEPKVEVKESSLEERTTLNDGKNYFDLLGDSESRIISDNDLDVHIVKEFGIPKLVYVYKIKLSGRKRTDKFFVHVYIKESSDKYNVEEKNFKLNFDFDFYEPMKLYKNGTEYYILSRSLSKEGETSLELDDIKFVATGRYASGLGRSESYRSEEFANTKTVQLKNNNTLKTYCLFTDIDSYRKISEKREGALKNKILLTADNDMVNGKISDCNGEKLKMDFRLKGDWVDHLVDPNKWSFRVIMDNGKTFLGMRKFSFQHPKSRNYIWEWLFHKVIKKEGLIGLRYDFCNLELNIKEEDSTRTKSLGIMALEESFDKILIENNKMREGVIIGFDESTLWNNREKLNRFGVNRVNDIDFIKTAPIKVYNQNKVLSDSKLSNQFTIAKGLLDGLRNGDYKISDVFDIDKLTTFTALSNLFGGNHGLVVHNIRVYYNPITNKLEPIAFDALPGERQIKIVNYPFSANDEKYEKLLLEKLQLFSDENFVKSVLRDYSSELEELIFNLSSEFKELIFEPEVLAYNSNFIKSELNPADAIVASLVERGSDVLTLKVNNLTDYAVSISGLHHKDGKRLDLGVDSGFIPAKQERVVKVDLNPYFINAFVSKKNKNGAFRFPKDVDKLILSHELVGVNYNREAHILPYTSSAKSEDSMHLYQEMFKPNVAEFEFAEIHKDSIVFKAGQYSTSKSIVIAEGTKLYVEKGFELNFSNNASLVCFSPVSFNGTKSEPIKFYSNDSTGRGLFISNAKETSILNYCYFSNLSNPMVHGWTLSGAVNFHESDVNISNSYFTGNRCEDFLNIIRSEFTLSNSTIINSMSDSFDGDFVTGEIIDCEFINCGNDGIDVSGSQLTLKGIRVDTPSDKAISAGEGSNVEGSEIEIRAGEIGIVCKDLSVVNLSNVTVVDTRLAVAVFQKKPEYGIGKIHLEKVSFTNNERDYLIESGSILAVDELTIASNSDDVTEQMYGREYGKSSK